MRQLPERFLDLTGSIGRNQPQCIGRRCAASKLRHASGSPGYDELLDARLQAAPLI
jgi:hypothetical protein